MHQTTSSHRDTIVNALALTVIAAGVALHAEALTPRQFKTSIQHAQAQAHRLGVSKQVAAAVGDWADGDRPERERMIAAMLAEAMVLP